MPWNLTWSCLTFLCEDWFHTPYFLPSALWLVLHLLVSFTLLLCSTPRYSFSFYSYWPFIFHLRFFHPHYLLSSPFFLVSCESIVNVSLPLASLTLCEDRTLALLVLQVLRDGCFAHIDYKPRWSHTCFESTTSTIHNSVDGQPLAAPIHFQVWAIREMSGSAEPFAGGQGLNWYYRNSLNKFL